MRFLRPSPPCGKSVLTSRLKSCAAKVGDLPPFSPSPNGSANFFRRFLIERENMKTERKSVRVGSICPNSSVFQLTAF